MRYNLTIVRRNVPSVDVVSGHSIIQNRNFYGFAFQVQAVQIRGISQSAYRIGKTRVINIVFTAKAVKIPLSIKIIPA